ncbi:protein of unknown function [Thermococcus camini]|uniref:Uncharacterized protein n=1 Tax=Thermococcus camini TaxID=2016373 RepID=A0A7G2DBK2_9EURY|nr:protein of unknown function [Thermococcus camini]
MMKLCAGKVSMVAPPGFEPGSRDPKSRMLGRYTTGLPDRKAESELINLKLWTVL